MASEAVLIIETDLPIMMTCSNTTGIAKGAILKLSDPMTVALANGDADIPGGIAAEEKIASDGKTKIAVYRRGIFKVLAGANITVGQALNTYASTGATNEVYPAAAGHDHQLGTALDTFADTETGLMELKCNTRDEA